MNSIRFDTQTITPSKVVCIGRNYVDHAKELNNEVPTSPVIFLKPNSAICNELYAGTEQTLHYEGEIALLIIGGEIAGAGFGLDLTNRDIQNQLKEKGLPWERAKAFDRAAVFSAFVPLTQPLESLRLELDINGARAQQGGYPLMIFKPEFLLQEISRFFTLEDGDIIMTGTPKGVGAFRQGDQFKGSIFFRRYAVGIARVDGSIGIKPVKALDEEACYPLNDIRSVMQKLPQIEALGLTTVEFNRGSCLFEVKYATHLVGNIESGVIHGGVITTLLDSAGGAAAFSVVPVGSSVATLDLRIDYLKQAERERSILGYATCYRQTQHIVFVKGCAYHESPDDPIAHFVASFMVGSVGFAPNA